LRVLAPQEKLQQPLPGPVLVSMLVLRPGFALEMVLVLPLVASSKLHQRC